ncbi:hypothetical protein HPP92_005327 [Vanilla planifolia]|uniref:Uncharacterized protein n=1 Tax=Vanilla planifolia TaxID=51239 RepID=A0A835RIG2_VANPL|nr:hypothetical protein HPP92_005327 [Vanilla planifolia]
MYGLAAGVWNTKEGVGALVLECIGDLLRRRPEALLQIREKVINRILRMPRLQRRIDPFLRVEGLLRELPQIHHYHRNGDVLDWDLRLEN